MKFLKTYILTPIIYIFVFFYLVIEEYLWQRIFRHIYLKIKAFNLLYKFNSYIKKQNNRYYLLLIFIIPFVLMEILATIGVFLTAKGLVILGVIFYSLKLLLTVPVVIIFNSSKKKLLSFYLIRISYFGIIKIKRNEIFRNTKRKIRILKLYLKELFKNLYQKILDKFSSKNK